MQGARMVEASPAGRSAGLAAAYDRYAAPLYGYCRSLLGEPAEAADAVQDTFIIAAGKLGGLRDPGRLRAWLYAVARNECHRRLDAGASSVPFDGPGMMSDETADKPGEVGGDPADGDAEAERAELRALVAAGLAGLNPGDREVVELNLRHDLAGRDLADVLGVTPSQANVLPSRARSQFERSLGEHRDLGPAMLLCMLPAALPPAGLRGQLLNLVGDFSPASLAYRAKVINRAGPSTAPGVTPSSSLGAAANPTVPANVPAPAAPGTNPLFPGAATPSLAVPTPRSSPSASCVGAGASPSPAAAPR